MIFASDNWAGATSAVMTALANHTSGFATAYGVDPLSRSIERQFNDLFEKEVAVFLVSTGTAANSLALATYAKPGGAIFCHEEAHINVDECHAPEFFTAGNKLIGVAGENGKLTPDALRSAMNKVPDNNPMHGRPAAVSISQVTELGTIYQLDEIQALADVTHSRNVPLHMDGARFANALVSLDVSPAEMTWKSGVDVLSFGGTKNGCWCAEAVVFFKPEDSDGFEYLRKRAAQVFSKARFISAQFEGYLKDDSWLVTARHANEMCTRLANGMRDIDGVRLLLEPEANELFPVLKKEQAERLKAAGAEFYESAADFTAEDEVFIRLVTCFATTPEQVDEFLRHLRG
ncbi:Low specificity L-threonine aldolase [Pseudovibrio axinellae]|uniref:L-threonine aldolase n=1 Tax=Pseudovibrio axinellae TaxID=989403 RepID=A0A161V1Y5_9HYPH|nr:low specificity L-threonine aldolase [Pseudovibrio axinellae]KZL20760.1 Low specificity L-threonine aldolase [Pseudovibrio axinellae]SER23470.1 L-threonine aldolase [Pseudovibrio axinellae]